MSAVNNLLSIENLSITYPMSDRSVNIVEALNITVPPGAAVGLVGESGSGKSMTALATMRLLPAGMNITSGRILLNGMDVLAKTEAEMRHVRGKEIALVFQSSKTALNPLMTVGKQIARVYEYQFGMKHSEAWGKTIEMLQSVGINQPQRRANYYPHQFSGGMAQRVMIALAIACNPKLLIADEPTTGLDVTTEAQILDLLAEIRAEYGSSLLLITHNLGLVAAYCDYVGVMHAGHIVEFGRMRNVFQNPKHPYTQGLLSSVLRPDREVDAAITIEGRPPSLEEMPMTGCRFIYRCPHRMDRCVMPVPKITVEAEHSVLCHLYVEG